MLGFLLLEWGNYVFPPIPAFLYLTALIPHKPTSFPVWSHTKVSLLNSAFYLISAGNQDTPLNFGWMVWVQPAYNNLYKSCSGFLLQKFYYFCLLSIANERPTEFPGGSSLSPLWIRAVSWSLSLDLGSYSTSIYAEPITCQLCRTWRNLGDHFRSLHFIDEEVKAQRG